MRFFIMNSVKSIVKRHRLKILLVVATTLAVYGTGCSRSQDQIEFEQQAYRTPENYTETTPDGKVVSRDEDDWRIGPMFQGIVDVVTPPYPNPTHGEPLVMELHILHDNIQINGLHAVTYYDVFDPLSAFSIYHHPHSPLRFGHLIIDIYPDKFDLPRQESYSAARDRNDGLHRLFIYDNRRNLITYGDIKLK